MPKGENLVATVALLVGIALVALSIFGEPLPVPDQGLDAWTDWAAKYVAFVIAATKVWKLADRLIAKV